MPTDISDLLVAIEQAERAARSAHDDGTCHESEWSCSWCEVDADRA